MLKKFLIVLGTLIVFVTICGYFIYANRTKLINKVVDYTMQSMLSGEKATELTNADDEDQSWVGTLLGVGSENIKYAVTEIMSKRGVNGKTREDGGARRQSLATVADMLINGTGTDKSGSVNQMAKMLISSFDTGTGQQRNPVEHDINARDEKGRTLLMNVCRVDVTPRVVKMMMRYGADIYAVDNEGRTVLMYAAALNKNIKVVKLLIDSGVNAGAMDYNGKTAYDYAEDPEIKEFLRSYVAQ
ncbi:MAG: ankyrin repeat domain-containing protein [Alphaproteobacteria bacterium]|nr:ankyrin repeat domain-containing protein [Alphaproteobacteria bacterium]